MVDNVKQLGYREKVREQEVRYEDMVDLLREGDIYKLKTKFASKISPEAFEAFFKTQHKAYSDGVIKNNANYVKYATPPEMPDLKNMMDHNPQAKIDQSELMWMKTMMSGGKTETKGTLTKDAVKETVAAEAAYDEANQFSNELDPFLTDIGYELLKTQIESEIAKQRQKVEEFVARCKELVRRGASPLLLVHAATKMLLFENGSHAMKLGLELKHATDVEKMVTEQMTGATDAQMYQLSAESRSAQYDVKMIMMGIQNCVERSEKILNMADSMDREFMKALREIDRNIGGIR